MMASNCQNVLPMSFGKTIIALLQFCVFLCFILTLVKSANGSPQRRLPSSILNDDDTTIKSEVIDINNQTILNMFNLTSEQIKRMSTGGVAAKSGSTSQSRDSQRFTNIKEHRLDDIKTKIQLAIQGYHGGTDENPTHPQHEMAAYPICNSETNESTWQHDNNVTIRFSDSLFEPKSSNLNLDSAILRLYKINPNRTDETFVTSSPSKGKCSEPSVDSQIRVTVSIVQQVRKNKREKKKRICNTIMMNVSQTGWVEIDIKRAIFLWESIEQQNQQQQQQQQQQQHQQQQQQQGRLPVLVGWLMIEVHDEEERPLKPGLFFNPPKCDQADYAIPWNFYRLNKALPSSFTDGVPRSPRLDVRLVGYGSFHPATQRTIRSRHPSNLNSDTDRELYHLTLNSAEDTSTTSITPTDNLLEPSAPTDFVHKHKKRHSHRHHHHHNQHNHHQEQQQQQQHQHQHQLDQYDVDQEQQQKQQQQQLRLDT